MMVTSVRIDGCADHMNEKPDLSFEKHKLTKSGNPNPKFN